MTQPRHTADSNAAVEVWARLLNSADIHVHGPEHPAWRDLSPTIQDQYRKAARWLTARTVIPPDAVRQKLTERADRAEAALNAVRAELDRIAALPTVAYDDGRADTFPVGVRWAIRILRENALGEPQKLPPGEPPVHIGNRVNAEDCPGCSGTNLPYPFICPAQPGDPGGPNPS